MFTQENAKVIINGKEKNAVADCLCRTQQGLIDKVYALTDEGRTAFLDWLEVPPI